MGADPITAVLGATQAGFDIFGQHEAQTAQRDQYRLFKQLFAEGRSSLADLFGQAIGGTNTYYDKIDRILAQSGHTARTQAIQRGEQYAADATESAINRGQFGGSYLDSLRGGIEANTTNELSTIEEQVAAAMAGSLRGRSTALTDLLSRQGLATADLFADEARGLLGFQHGSSKTNLMGFGPLLGNIFGGGWGGGGGGGDWGGGGYPFGFP